MGPYHVRYLRGRDPQLQVVVAWYTWYGPSFSMLQPFSARLEHLFTVYYWSKPATGAHPARIVATQDDLRVSDIRPASVTFEVVQAWSCSSYILPNLAMKIIFKKPCNCIKADLHASIMDGFSYIEETRSTGLSGGCWYFIPATPTVDSALWNAISGAKLL